MPNPFTRSDTLLGVCQALGEEFGFNPTILRVAFGLALFWNPTATIIAYLAIGAVVLASRLALPTRVSPARSAATVPQADNDEAAVTEKIAA